MPATGAYTLAMGSTYNGVPRPAVVLVRDGEARVIRRREAMEDLLRYDTDVRSTEDVDRRLSSDAWSRPRQHRGGDVGARRPIRKPLDSTTTATTIVFGEHVVLVALTLPLLLPALERRVWRAGPRYLAAAIAIGAGASAIATILFTRGPLPRRLHHAGRDPEGPAAGRRPRGGP